MARSFHFASSSFRSSGVSILGGGSSAAMAHQPPASVIPSTSPASTCFIAPSLPSRSSETDGCLKRRPVREHLLELSLPAGECVVRAGHAERPRPVRVAHHLHVVVEPHRGLLPARRQRQVRQTLEPLPHLIVRDVQRRRP